ncbi:MAG: ribosomal RNA small subunit methyltransferase H [Phycisphaerae bacterium]
MALLNPQPGEIVADCTLGFGGHAAAFLHHIGPEGRLVGFDVDGPQLESTRRQLQASIPGHHVSLYRSNFAGIGNVLAREGLDGYDVIFADLGVSSMQIDDPAKGFSYKHDGPLDMRMDDRIRRTAADWLAVMTEEELSSMLDALADEPDHERIARCIVDRRDRQPLRTTFQLVELIFEAKGLSRKLWREQMAAASGTRQAGAGPTPPSRRVLHPAARTFQALRIQVNDELGSLRQLLRTAPYCLRPRGRIGILTFHSGEDRLVQAAFEEGRLAGLYAEAPDEPVRPSPQERRDNTRSAPARLRWARRP